ncbi:MAG TPA: sensor domain-containing diguanylate cyclase [Candidatus Dormibacteraeota bacterium]
MTVISTRTPVARIEAENPGLAPDQRAMERQLRLLRGLLEASASMHDALGLDEVLGRIAQILAAAGGFSGVAVYILDRTTGELQVRATVGVSDQDVARMRSHPLTLEGMAPLMQPQMLLSRSYLFDHRRDQMPEDTILDNALSIPELAPDWRPGMWHPLDSLTIPLDDGQTRLGLLSLDEPADQQYPELATVQALELFADQCAAAIARVQLHQQLEQLAMTDSLTGLHNRHVLEDALARELQRAERTERPCSVLFCDLDNFKQVNDRFDHATGDQILQQVAAVIRQRLRRGDLAARYGGDEFVVLLPETDLAAAVAVAEDLRGRIEAVPARTPVTVSIGVASSAGLRYEGSSFLAAADAAMYLAKSAGRNRVRKARRPRAASGVASAARLPRWPFA